MGTTYIYITPSTPYGDVNPLAPKISVGTANGQFIRSRDMASLTIPQVGHCFPTKGYVMPSFAKTLVRIGPLCDAGCYVTFAKHNVTVYN